MNQLTNDEVIGIIDNEGLAYAVQHYMSASDIGDPELAELWLVATASLKNIEDYLSI